MSDKNGQYQTYMDNGGRGGENTLRRILNIRSTFELKTIFSLVSFEFLFLGSNIILFSQLSWNKRKFDAITNKQKTDMNGVEIEFLIHQIDSKLTLDLCMHFVKIHWMPLHSIIESKLQLREYNCNKKMRIKSIQQQ